MSQGGGSVVARPNDGHRTTMSLFNKIKIASFSVSTLVALVSGCSESEPSQADETARTPIGKADAASGSCNLRCGVFDPDEACQCDEDCLEFGDCCEDYESVCEDGCSPGDTTPAEDGCNTCTCDDDGTWACTELACDGDGCEPGQTAEAEDGCNTCVCNDDGTWSCTELLCDDDACEPGVVQPQADGCNTCTCGDDGHWSCTEVFCGGPACDPGEIVDAPDGCNTCICAESGGLVCTELAC